jgi:molybdate transport system substrate-binding protein
MVPPDGERRFMPALLLSTALTGGCHPNHAPVPAPVQVAAAADLSVAFEEMGKLFEARTGQRVTFSFGASGSLARQLTEGAPFDLFAAANASFVDSAVASGACDGRTKARYARGHLLAWAKQSGVPLRSLQDLLDPSIEHIAIANPEHAPYGKAAREALQRAGIWPAVEHKIVQAENVRQALQFAESGNAEVALVARSLLGQEESRRALLISPSLHAPIDQTLVVCRHGKNAQGGRDFAKFVESGEGQALLGRYGFGSAAE